LLQTFKALVAPVFNYAAPIIFPFLSKTSVKLLQVVQNNALRVVTGCHRAASSEHVHHECETLPVEDHLRLLSCQFYANALQADHPSHGVVSQESGPRGMKSLLQSLFSDELQPFLENNSLPPGRYGEVVKSLHTNAVEKAIVSLNLKPNRVLGGNPLAISKSESRLPRTARALLSQLRSGFCKHLNHYKNFIDAAADALCPSCELSTHTVNHLFDCPARPTTLSVHDLWVQPEEVINFLATSRLFRPILAANPPRPPPPPEPPPPGG